MLLVLCNFFPDGFLFCSSLCSIPKDAELLLAAAVSRELLLLDAREPKKEDAIADGGVRKLLLPALETVGEVALVVGFLSSNICFRLEAEVVSILFVLDLTDKRTERRCQTRASRLGNELSAEEPLAV